MGRFAWMEDTDDKIAVQLQTLGRELPAYATLFGIANNDVTYLQQGGAVYAYLQLQAVIAVRNLGTSLTKMRDNFEVDLTPEPFVFPTFDLPTPPTITVALNTDFFDWCNVLIKRIQASPNYNDAIGTILGLVVSRPVVESGPLIRSYKALPGGVLRLSVYRGGQPMILVEAKVDNGAWEQKAAVVSSKVTVHVPAGAAHIVQLRSRFAERDGTPIGDYSPIIEVSSMP